MEEDDDDYGMLKQAINMRDEINRNCSDKEKRIVTKNFQIVPKQVMHSGEEKMSNIPNE